MDLQNQIMSSRVLQPTARFYTIGGIHYEMNIRLPHTALGLSVHLPIAPHLAYSFCLQ